MHIPCGVFRPFPLFAAADHRQVMESRPDVPQRIPFPGESLSGIGHVSRIDNHRLSVLHQNERTHVVVIVIFPVMSAFAGQHPFALFNQPHL